MTVRILEGDCIELMRTLPDCSVDSVVTDPPYGIRFMGKAWDGADIDKRHAARKAMPSQDPTAGPNGGHKSAAAEAGKYNLAPEAMRAFQEFSREWAVEALRVLKPGGHLLSFASARTYHRMTSGIEDAGFEIRDQIMWIYGSGFPKSRNLSRDWEGWGTALKPAHEPIVVARKPLVGTVAANVMAHGVGALNIAASRVPTNEPIAVMASTGGRKFERTEDQPNRKNVQVGTQTDGRWPANVMHDGSDEVLSAFADAPGQQGDLTGHSRDRKSLGIFGDMPAARDAFARGDSGSASRFFYCAKASKADREIGCEGLPTKRGGMVSNTSGQHLTRRDGGEPGERANHHPTVKPTELMRYLVRLITPPRGVVLDPFAGSGSTGRAADIEGFDAILIEIDPEYAAIARRRICGDSPMFAEVASA